MTCAVQRERDGSVAHAKGRARESNPYADEAQPDPNGAVARIESMLRDAWWRGSGRSPPAGRTSAAAPRSALALSLRRC